ncbi:MAG: Zn-ribbon domain-containing OB-fold protein [Anaerolineales bacterium]|jgi:uncharacterized OB-fold protein
MDIPRNWRLRQQRYGLVGEQCEHCHAKIFPPRDICPECGRATQSRFSFSGQGEVYSFTVIHDAPSGYETQAPYAIALVKLAEGPLVTAQITDVDPRELRIGLPVEMVTRKLRAEGEEGLIQYGYKFRPVLAAV